MSVTSSVFFCTVKDAKTDFVPPSLAQHWYEVSCMFVQKTCRKVHILSPLLYSERFELACNAIGRGGSPESGWELGGETKNVFSSNRKRTSLFCIHCSWVCFPNLKSLYLDHFLWSMQLLALRWMIYHKSTHVIIHLIVYTGWKKRLQTTTMKFVPNKPSKDPIISKPCFTTTLNPTGKHFPNKNTLYQATATNHHYKPPNSKPPNSPNKENQKKIRQRKPKKKQPPPQKKKNTHTKKTRKKTKKPKKNRRLATFRLGGLVDFKAGDRVLHQGLVRSAKLWQLG